MFDLFINEIKQYRLFSGITALVLLAILGFISSMQPFMANDLEVTATMVIAMLLAFTFGCTQMLLHRRKNHWTYLVHRPISTHSIHRAITCAGICLLTVAFVLPVLLLLICLDLLAVDIVEARHYLFVLHLLGLVMFCYFVGIYTVLNPCRGALLTIAWLYFMLSNDPNSAMLTLTTDLVCVAVVFWLSRQSFKVNLSAHFTRKRDIALAATAMHLGLIGGLYFSQVIFYHLPLTLVDQHPDRLSKEELQGYYSVLWLLDGEETVDLIVNENHYPEKDTLKKQVKHAELNDVQSRINVLPQPHQLFHLDKSYALNDKKSKTRWIFSHHHQVFIGKSNQDKQLVGYIGARGFIAANIALDTLSPEQRFSVVPMIDDGKYIRTENAVYAVDFEHQYLDLKHQLPDGEHYTYGVQQNNDASVTVLLSNKAVYLFNTRQFDQEGSYTEPDLVISHPADINKMGFISFYSLYDGYLFNYYSSNYFGVNKPGTSLVYAKFDGTQTLLGEKAFEHYRPLPYLITHQQVIMSPVLYGVVIKYLDGLFKPDDHIASRPLNELLAPSYPETVNTLIVVTWLISLALTLWLVRQLKFTMKRQIFWLLLVAVMSFTGLVAFLLLNDWRGRLLYRHVAPKTNGQFTATASNVT